MFHSDVGQCWTSEQIKKTSPPLSRQILVLFRAKGREWFGLLISGAVVDGQLGQVVVVLQSLSRLFCV